MTPSPPERPTVPPALAADPVPDPGPGWFFLGGVDGWVRVGRDDLVELGRPRVVGSPWGS